MDQRKVLCASMRWKPGSNMQILYSMKCTGQLQELLAEFICKNLAQCPVRHAQGQGMGWISAVGWVEYLVSMTHLGVRLRNPHPFVYNTARFPFSPWGGRGTTVQRPTHLTVLLFVEEGRSVLGGIEGMHNPLGNMDCLDTSARLVAAISQAKSIGAGNTVAFKTQPCTMLHS